MKKKIIHHLKVLFVGFLHALKGTLAVAFIGFAVALFCCVNGESGYIAVGDFVMAAAGVCIALVLLYSCGRDLIKKKGAFSK